MGQDFNQIDEPTVTARPLITSDADPLRVDFLPHEVMPFPGRLGMTLAPGKSNVGMQALWQRDLQLDLTRLQQHYQVNLLVTLLERHELAQLQIPDLFNQIETYGMQTRWFPIEDFGTPTSMQGLIGLVEEILTAVQQAETVVIHCKAGLGRTGLVTAACLVALGYSSEAAFLQVRQARPGSVETDEQEEYVAQFVEAWQASRAAQA